MNELMNLGLFAKKETVYVSSRDVAKNFDKNHSSIVVRAIENIIKNLDGSVQNCTHLFIESSYQDDQNKQFYKEYLVTRDGFSLLAMGFTGRKALAWKLKYIEAFNLMEHAIREKLSTEWKETRIKGKLQRRNETDVIMTKLIPLAELQGSKNSGKLYMTYSKLVNECVGIPSNSRENATQRVLDVVYNLENLIENVIVQESDKGTYYKDIYQICKGKCKLMVDLSYLPQQKMIR